MSEDEFMSLYQSLSRSIFSYAARRLPADTASDVVSDTFEVVWAKHAEAPADADGRAAWIFGIAKNKVRQAYQHRTRKHHDHRFAADFTHIDPTDADIADEVTSALTGATIYQQLSDPERELFDIAFLQELDRNTGAAMLGLTVGAFTTRVSRLRARLLELERRLGDEPPAMAGGTR